MVGVGSWEYVLNIADIESNKNNNDNNEELIDKFAEMSNSKLMEEIVESDEST